MALLHSDVNHFKPMLAEIEDSPANPLAHLTLVIIIATIVFFLVWSTVGTIDVVVAAPGKVIPSGHAKVVQSVDNGIISKILVHEGDVVHRGQSLIVVDSSVATGDLAALREKYQHTKLEIDRIEATLQDKPFNANSGDSIAAASQKQLFNSDKELLASQLAEKQSEINQIDEQEREAMSDHQSAAELFRLSEDRKKRWEPCLEAIPKDEFDKCLAEVVTNQEKVAQAEHKLVELAHQKQTAQEAIGRIKREFSTNHLTDLSDKQKQLAELEAQVKELEFKTRKQVITSPADGYINELFAHTVGGVVSPAEKLMTIVPSNTEVSIVTSVSNTDIGYVHAGLPVQLKIDTFDFQKYGMIEGIVSLVSYDSHDSESKTGQSQAEETEKKLDQVFEVYIKPKKTSLDVDGATQELKPGMTVRAEFKVTKRRIIDFFIYPLIKDWHEGISVR